MYILSDIITIKLFNISLILQNKNIIFQLSDIVNIWSPTGDLPLFLALKSRNSSLASTLLQHNADINIRDNQGETLLHKAIKQDDSFATLFLLENNCDATLTTRNENNSPLHLLASSSNIEDVEKIAVKLINKNVNINAQNRQGFTALHIAIMADNRTLFDILMSQQNIEINVKTADEHTPLYFALLKYESGVDDKEESYAARLIKKEAQTNPIYSENCDNLMQVLLRYGARKAAVFLAGHTQNLNHVNQNGESALHTACYKDCPELVRVLLKSGANPNALTNESRRTPLHFAVLCNSKDCIEVFIEYNEGIEKEDGCTRSEANFNVRDIEGDTPLSLALKEGFEELVPVLIRGKGDVNVRNGKDFTLLHQAILKEDARTAIFLLDNGADINAK